MAEVLVRKLKFPGSEDSYLINADQLDGHDYSEIEGKFNELQAGIETLQSFDAMRYMGTVDSAEGPLPKADKGDVYKVTFNGKLLDTYEVEVGDMLICREDGTAENTPDNWDIVQSNVDVEAILAQSLEHTHTGNVTFTHTPTTLSHEVTPTEASITAQFSNGAATVNGSHGHTATGTVTSSGSVVEQSITPEGTVTLTSPTSAGTGDVTVTPAGTVGAPDTNFVTGVTVAAHEAHTHSGTTNNETASVTGTITVEHTPEGTVAESTTEFLTGVTAGEVELSKHNVSETAAGGHDHTGSVAINAITPVGTISSHGHNISGTAADVVTGIEHTCELDDDGETLVITCTATTGSVDVTGTATEVGLEFTGTPVTPTGTITIDAVADHTHSVSVADHNKFIPVLTPTTAKHNHTFSGTKATLTATHNLSAAHTHTFTTAENTLGLSHNVTAPTAAHNHTFTGSPLALHAAFTGTAASHTHDFTGGQNTVNVTVNDFSGNFTGTATGNVGVTHDAIKSVTIGTHSYDKTTGGSFTTSEGTAKN